MRTRLINISPSYRTIYRAFQIILEWELSIELEFKSYVLCKSTASKEAFNLIGTKIYEQWQGLMERAQINNLNQWSGWWQKYIKQACSRSTI